MTFEKFKEPNKKYRPIVRWWWPGLDVEEEELRQEVNDLDKAGFGGAELQPFGIGTNPKITNTERLHRFMHPYHYEMMKAVIDEAKKLGLFIDITQNSAWPTGGNHITLEHSFQTLIYATTVVKGGKQQKFKAPKLKKPGLYKFFEFLGKLSPYLQLVRWIPEDKKVTRVVAGKLIGKKGKIIYKKVKQSAVLDKDSLVDLTSSLDEQGNITWDVPEGNWQVFACYEGSAGGLPVMDARSKLEKGLVVDHFNKEAALFHLNAFLGKAQEYFGEEFGKTFRSFFTDSLEFITPMIWTQNFLDEFKKRRGYDLTPYLPIIYIPLRDVGYWSRGHEIGLPCFELKGDNFEGERIRYDYERTVSDLFVDEFIKPIQQWGKEKGVPSRVQAYGARIDNIEALGYSGIPEVEQLYGAGCLHFLKFGGAAGAFYNRPIVTSESMVWQERPYMTTPTKWRVAADRLFESGVNQMIYHGFPYRAKNYPYPGFHPFSARFSGDFSRDAEFWEYYPIMNQYVTRMQYLMQESKTIATVGLYHGIFDYPTGAYIKEEMTEGILDDEDGQKKPKKKKSRFEIIFSGEPEGERLYVKESAEIGNDLVANGYYYLPINRDRILNSEVRDNKLIIGEAELSCLVFYKITHLPHEMVSKLKEIADAGIPIIFINTKPHRQSGFNECESHDVEVISTVDEIASKFSSYLEESKNLVQFLKSKGIKPQIIYTEPKYNIGFIQKKSRTSEDSFVMLRNREKTSAQHKIEVPIKAIPYLFDAFSGERNQLDYTNTENGISFTLNFSPYESFVVGLTSNVGESTPYPPIKTIQRTQLADISTLESIEIHSWQLEIQKREVDGNTTLIQRTLETLEDWREDEVLKECSGPAIYSTSFTLPTDYDPEKFHLFLHFERVCDIATVTINGESKEPLMMAPWSLDVSKEVKTGENILEIKLETTLRNLIVGYSNTKDKQYKKQYKEYHEQTLMPTGLIGKVSLVKIKRE